MADWISVDVQLPSPDLDIWATDGIHVEMGFRSYADTDKSDWLDFSFPVSHWLPCIDDEPPLPPNVQ